ncbi:54S ribosomal protein L8, mitochondrial [Metarhizium acridum]|uniref:54S ribosomal protein L8, mitochondrial n=1 Tax=Metarhizium acridum TaxID=92637 RepID=UPI001C6CDEB6|nr:54S ribosomal protein L8, mitochondrial [Metarhizium acridum]
MAGGLVKYRHLSRNSSARKALLRGLVTQLVQYEHIQTTHAKAKEAQRLAEKLITLAKKNNEPCRRSAQAILYTPHVLLPKLFGEIRNRYLTREGGYTRVVRTEPKNTYDQGESSILEFVDGPKDSRFMMTAKTIARDRLLGQESTPVTAQNIKKVTQFRGEKDLEDMVQRFLALQTSDAAAAEEGHSVEAARIAGEECSKAQALAAEVKTQKKEAKS